MISQKCAVSLYAKINGVEQNNSEANYVRKISGVF